MTVLMTLQEIIDQRMKGRLDLAEFVEAVWEFGEDTLNDALMDAVDVFDEEAETDMDKAEEHFEAAVKRIAQAFTAEPFAATVIDTGYPDALTPADLAALPRISLTDFNTLKAYGTVKVVGKTNTGTAQAPVWEERYVIDRHEIDGGVMSRELQLFKQAVKQGNTFALTRLYLTKTASSVTVIPNATWNVTTGNVVYNLVAAQDGSALQTTNSGSGNPGQKMLNKTFVSAPLAAQTIKGSVHLQIASRHGKAAPTDVVMTQLIFFRLLNNDGSVAAEIGSAISQVIPDGSSSILNCPMDIGGLNITIAAGQRLCFGVGGHYISGTGGTAYIRQNLGAPLDRPDLPYGDAQVQPGTPTGNPWIEFSQPIKFQ